MCVAHDKYTCHLHIVGCSLRIQPISFSKKGKKEKKKKKKEKKKRGSNQVWSHTLFLWLLEPYGNSMNSYPKCSCDGTYSFLLRECTIGGGAVTKYYVHDTSKQWEY